jgi:ubiquitin C-terminal hydrolase
MTTYKAINLYKYDKEEGKMIYKLKNGLEIYIQNNKLYVPEELNQSDYDNMNRNSHNINYYNDLNYIKPCGLFNIGGVCYMNAVLQCFFYCRPLTEFFLNLNPHNQKLGPISKGYLSLIKGLSSGNKNAAQNFKQAMIKTDEMFYGTEGNDSKDVAILILSELHNELKPNKNNEIINLNRTVNNFDLNDVYNEKLELDKINGNNTIISKTFNFCMKYKQHCKKKCKKYSKPFYTLETDNIVLLELENLFPCSNSKFSVEDCLKMYTSTKKPIECPFCQEKSLYIQNIFCILPKILILVFSRGYHNKFKCQIKFNETLDMEDYYEAINEDENISTKYNLIGATFAYDWNYEGTGHTVAFCKTYQQGNYYVFNDRSTRKSNINEINGKLPYLLFYEREN